MFNEFITCFSTCSFNATRLAYVALFSGIINSPDRHCHSPIDEDEEKGESPLIVGSKHPKSDSVVIEELRELSGQLKDSVQGK